MGYKNDWTDEEILQYALGKLDVSEYEIDGLKYFLKYNPVAKQKYENYLKIINMEQTFQPTEKEHEEFRERMIKIIKEQNK